MTKEQPLDGTEFRYPDIPCAICRYTGKVTVTFYETTKLGDEQVTLVPAKVNCSFCGNEYDSALLKAPPPPKNYTPPADPKPLGR